MRAMLFGFSGEWVWIDCTGGDGVKEGVTPICADDTDSTTDRRGEIRIKAKAKCTDEIQGSLPCATDDEAVRRSGRDDVGLGWERGNCSSVLVEMMDFE